MMQASFGGRQVELSYCGLRERARRTHSREEEEGEDAKRSLSTRSPWGERILSSLRRNLTETSLEIMAFFTERVRRSERARDI